MLIKRGQVYYISADTHTGAEIGMYRPGVVISSTERNEKSSVVTIVYATTGRGHDEESILVPLPTSRKRSVAVCDQIFTVDKSRVGRFMFELTDFEMFQIEMALGKILKIGNGPESTEEETSSENDELYKLHMEAEMYKRLYEKAMSQLVDAKFANDLERKPESKIIPVIAAADPQPELIDLNTAKFDDFVKLGLSANQVCNILNSRPFKAVEFLKFVPGITDIAYQLVAPKVFVSEVASAPKKVNINTATLQDLTEKAGISADAARRIVAYRNKHGRFSGVKDLLNVDRFGEIRLAKYAPLLEV